MGGAINYQAARPDPSEFDFHFRGGWERNSDDDGYSGNVMVNAPIASDTFAVRGVFGSRTVPGFVNNVGTGQSHSNESTVDGGRLMALYAPSDSTTLNYLFLDQTTSTDDIGSSEPAIDEYRKSTLIPEAFEFQTTLHDLRLDQELAYGTLTATATYHEKDFNSQQDFSGLVPAFAPVTFLEPGSSDGTSFEVRLASLSDQRFEYLVGPFL